MATNETGKRLATLRLEQIVGYKDIKEELDFLRTALLSMERKAQSFLTIEDLRKTNTAVGLLEKDIETLRTKLADLASIIPTVMRNVVEANKKIDHNANAFNMLKKEWDGLTERVNMAECDIEKLHDPMAFGPETKQPFTAEDVVEVLQSAKQRVATQQDNSAVSAIIFCTVPGDLRSRALLIMYLSVEAIWELSAKAPAVLTDEIVCQLLHEWHDGMVTHKDDILLAFDVAIKKEAICVR